MYVATAYLPHGPTIQLCTALFTITLNCSASPDHEDETEDDRRDAKAEPQIDRLVK